MENSDVHHLPEADSLPDGFVDSSELINSPTVSVKKEKQSGEYDQGSSYESSDENAASSRIFSLSLNEAEELDDPHGASKHKAAANDPHRQDIRTVPDLAHTTNCSDRIAKCSTAHEVSASYQSLDSTSEESNRLSALETKRPELVKEKRLEIVETKRKTSKKTVFSEKDFLELTLKCQQALAERDSAIAIREKLESLCRELQRQNRLLTDECKRVSTEGQNLRLDLSTRFQDAIKDVGIRLEEQKQECITQLKENDMLREKLKELAEQYTLSQQQYAQKLKQKHLENEIAELKHKQLEEKLIQEQSQMKTYVEQVSHLLQTEKTLRLQLASDGEKFQKFQETFLKSNEVFQTFKIEIEKMAKSMKELKKENRFLKSKCEKSDVTLIELVEEREKLKKQFEKTKNQKEKLESLCRSLHAERKPVPTGSNFSDSNTD